MLKINLSPTRSDSPQSIVGYAAPVLTLDGTSYDLSDLPDGATADHHVLGRVSRVADDYEVTIRSNHGANAPRSSRFPDPIIVEADGAVQMPEYDEPAQPIKDEEITDELA